MADNPIFSYTRRDYEGSRKEGLAKIPIISKGNWTDLNATDPGVIILDYVHALVDMMNYYQDHQALEAFITTAKERANIFRLAKQLSYKIRSAKGSICNVTFDSPLIYDYTVKIPRYTTVSTKSGIKYLTSQDAYLLAGEHIITIPCSQGILQEFTYTGTGISRFSSIAGARNQTIRLADDYIDIDSIEITDNLGRLWTPIDYIIFSTESDRVYQTELNPDNSITIKFGDGERGIVPESTDILTVKYVTTLGENGNIGKNQISILDTPIYNDRGQSIEFLVNNNLESSGGSAPQSSQEIRDLAPGAIKAQDRAVTLSDYENLAKLVDGVAEARAYDINTKPDLCLYHEVKVLITPKVLEGSIESLKSQVYDYLSRRVIPPTNLQILTPNYVHIDLYINVIKLDNAIGDRLRYIIEQEINKYFLGRSGAIGEPFYPDDLAAIIRNIEGVRRVASIDYKFTDGVSDISDFSVIKLNNSVVTVQ